MYLRTNGSERKKESFKLDRNRKPAELHLWKARQVFIYLFFYFTISREET
jgi:hypothetical protein